MSIYNVTLIYEDLSTWFAGSFDSLDSANAWIDEEKTRSYWQESTIAQIDEIVFPELGE